MDASDEVILPFPASLAKAPVVTHVRSTILIGSLRAVREHGYIEPYKRYIPRASLEEIEHATAATWLPLSLAMDHYRACDALDLSEPSQLALGGSTLDRFAQTMLGTVGRTMTRAGAVSLFSILARNDVFFSRSFIGGGTRVRKVGPKDAVLDVVGLPLVKIPYYRVAYRGFVHAGLSIFADNPYVIDVPKLATAAGVSYRISWV